MFNIKDLEITCPHCKGTGLDPKVYFGFIRDDNFKCETCNGVKVVLTDMGNELIDFIVKHLSYDRCQVRSRNKRFDQYGE